MLALSVIVGLDPSIQGRKHLSSLTDLDCRVEPDNDIEREFMLARSDYATLSS